MALFTKKLKDEDIVSKVTFGRPYEDLYYNFVDEEEFKKSMRWLFPNAVEKIEVPLNPKMPWRNGPAPKYDHDIAIAAIERRLDQLYRSFSISLPILKASESFQQKIAEIRSEGWLDWHILFAVGTIIINYKAQFRESPKNKEEMLKVYNDYFRKDETEWYIPIDENILSVKRILQELEFMMVSVLLRSFELEFHSETPNGKATVELLKHRFNFFDDGKEIKIF